MQLIIGTSAGGGAVAKHLAGHLPGHPAIVSQGMPAGGGLAAANYLDNVAADGTVIAAIQNTVPFEPFSGNGQAQFNPAKMNWRHADHRGRAPFHLAHCEDRKSARCAKPQLCSGTKSGDTVGTEIAHAYAMPGAVKKRLTEIYQLGQGVAR